MTPDSALHQDHPTLSMNPVHVSIVAEDDDIPPGEGEFDLEDGYGAEDGPTSTYATASAPWQGDEPPILQHMAWEHLPPWLRGTAQPFASLARDMCRYYRPSAERSVCLRHLLDAQAAAIRTAVEERTEAAKAKTA